MTELIKAGADVRCKDNDGYGGPFIQIELASSPVVRVGERLRRAIGNAPLAFGMYRSTALHLAVLHDGIHTATVLVKAGADVHCDDNKGYALGQHRGPDASLSIGSLSEIVPCFVTLPCRNTALHIAAKNGHTETAIAMFKAGADVHCKNNAGYDLGVHREYVRGGRSVHSGRSCRSVCSAV